MGAVRAQVSLNRKSNLPADVVTNTFHWVSDDFNPIVMQDAVEITSGVQAFYEAIDATLGAQLNGQGTIKIYDLHDPEPRVPVLQTTMAPLTVAATALPSEVAVCLSYRDSALSGQNAARRRGRVWIGPLASSWSTLDGTTGEPEPTPANRSTLLSAANTHLEPIVAGAKTWHFAVYSPTTAGLGGDPELAMSPIDLWYFDDAFDTQRRRGMAPTTRTTLAAS